MATPVVNVAVINAPVIESIVGIEYTVTKVSILEKNTVPKFPKVLIRGS